MGCHTWFYKKVEVTEDEVRKDVVKGLKQEIAFYNRMIIGDIDKDLLEAYPEWTPEYANKQIPIYERTLRIVKAGLCKLAMYNRYKSSTISPIYYFDTPNSTMYCDVNQPHDLFRIHNYPIDRLYSYKETIQFIKKHKKRISVYAWTDEKLKQFWKDYPDGMIKFG